MEMQVNTSLEMRCNGWPTELQVKSQVPRKLQKNGFIKENNTG